MTRGRIRQSAVFREYKRGRRCPVRLLLHGRRNSFDFRVSIFQFLPRGSARAPRELTFALFSCLAFASPSTRIFYLTAYERFRKPARQFHVVQSWRVAGAFVLPYREAVRPSARRECLLPVNTRTLPAVQISVSRMKLIRDWKYSSVSPGKPTMNVVRSAMPETPARIVFIRSTIYCCDVSRRIASEHVLMNVLGNGMST